MYTVTLHTRLGPFASIFLEKEQMMGLVKRINECHALSFSDAPRPEATLQFMTKEGMATIMPQALRAVAYTVTNLNVVARSETIPVSDAPVMLLNQSTDGLGDK